MSEPKVREALQKGVEARTKKYEVETFPKRPDNLTPEQEGIIKWLDAESSAYSRMHESDRPLLRSDLLKLAGISDFESRFDRQAPILVPPFVMIVLRSEYGRYQANYPILHSRISGYWLENGTGTSDNVVTEVRNTRPVTQDEMTKFFRAFPAQKLPSLFGALEAKNMDKARKAIVASIREATKNLESNITAKWPDGITDNGKKLLLVLEANGIHRSTTLMAELAPIVGDESLKDSDYTPAPAILRERYIPMFCCLVPLDRTNEHDYTINVPAVNVGSPSQPEVFFRHPSEWGADEDSFYGNIMEPKVKNIRPATDDEIEEYVSFIPDARLPIFYSALSLDQAAKLI